MIAVRCRVISGWPLLVEETMRQIANGKSTADALDLIVDQLADPDFARIISRQAG